MKNANLSLCITDRIRAGGPALFGVLVIGLVFFCFTAASAQPRFGRVASVPFSGRVNFDDRRKGKPTGLWIDLGSTVRFAWKQLRPVLTQQAVGYLNERDIGGGFRTSRDTLTLAENGDLFFGVDGSGTTLRYVLRGNRLDTSLRVPGPSPSGTDPRVSIKCDLEVTIDIDRSGIDLVASPARLKANCSRPVGQNFTGKVGIGVNDLIRFLGGPDFIGMFLKSINTGSLAMSQQVNLKFSGLLPRRTQNTSIGFSRRNDQLDLIFEEDQPLKVH
jgi:hypothetical protein